MASVLFFSEDVSYRFPDAYRFDSFVHTILRDKGFLLSGLTYIFCSDSHLLEINRSYLDHDYFTDVITFDYSESPMIILGDIFISIDRIADNAQAHQVTFLHELLRVMIHGLLHLMGYDDSTPELREQMHHLENDYLLKFAY